MKSPEFGVFTGTDFRIVCAYVYTYFRMFNWGRGVWNQSTGALWYLVHPHLLSSITAPRKSKSLTVSSF
jgi:hypothetical protein